MAKISVFGLGYVGAVSLACLAEGGHQVVGVDVNPTKVEMVNRGHSPIIEEGLPELLSQGVSRGCIRATTDAEAAVHATDVSFISVGTPSLPNGSVSLEYVERVCEQIGAALASKEGYHLVVARSTMLPGSTEGVVIPILEQYSGRRAGQDLGVCYNPEFLREGSSIKDFYDPPFTVIGGDDDRAVSAAGELYGILDAPLLTVPYKVAEMIKYACNAFHALKVTFANEIGNLCKRQGIDSHQVMDIFCLDTRLNLSKFYLKPGFAFGGSCLPKDLRALLYHSRHLDLQTPVLEAILPSNHQQVELAYQMVQRTALKRVGVLGFSFKAGTDDLRESPTVELIERLIGKGYQTRVYDRNVSLANLQGANRAYIEKEIPHIASLMCDSIDSLLDESDLVIIGNGAPEFRAALSKVRDGQVVIDLVRIANSDGLNGQYHGICW